MAGIEKLDAESGRPREEGATLSSILYTGVEGMEDAFFFPSTSFGGNMNNAGGAVISFLVVCARAAALSPPELDSWSSPPTSPFFLPSYFTAAAGQHG